MFEIVLIIFGILALLTIIFWLLYRRFRDFDDKIEADLSKYDLVLIDVSPAPFFAKSPFPSIEIYDFHYSTRIMGISGEEVFPRIVRLKDKNGNIHSLWIHITTRAFRFYNIKWEKDLSKI